MRAKGKKRIAGAVSLLLLLSLTGTACLKTPEVEYVRNKEGQDSLISDNTADVGETTLVEQLGVPKTVEGACEKVNEYTSIKIDAQVRVPEGNAVPVWQVEPMPISSEEMIERYAKILYDEGTIQNKDISARYNMSEEEIYEQIEYYTHLLDTVPVTDTPDLVFDENENMIEMNTAFKEELERHIEEMQMELERIAERPSETSLSYELQSYSEEKSGPNGIECNYEYQAAAFTGKHDERMYDLVIYDDGVNTALSFEMSRQEIMENGIPWEEMKWLYQEESGIVKEKENGCRYSREEAVALCEEFLSDLGIENMDVGYTKDLHLFHRDTYVGNKGHLLYFYWSCGNMKDRASTISSFDLEAILSTWNTLPLYSIADFEFDLDHLEDGYKELMLKGMAIFSVSDEGIMSAWIQNPAENRQLLAENVKLLEFEQIMKQGTAYLESSYGDSGTSGVSGYQNIVIRSVELNYARMQSPDSEDEFIMIPVWDFNEYTDGKPWVSVNAIDGSLFDREGGY